MCESRSGVLVPWNGEYAAYSTWWWLIPMVAFWPEAARGSMRSPAVSASIGYWLFSADRRLSNSRSART